jgi:TonB family protein
VIVSFIVSTSGEVIEPMIEDTSGLEALENAAIAAVRRWRYEPATMNGAPVEQSMVQTKITFRSEDSNPPGARASFKARYKEIAELIDSGELAEAEALLADLEFKGRTNLYEDAWFWWLKSIYLEKANGDETEIRKALGRALGYEEDYLDPNVFVVAIQRLYVSQVKQLMFAAARDTFERLRDSWTAQRSEHHEAIVAVLAPSYEQINEIAASDELLYINGEIGDHDYWVHRLFRRAFSLANVNGRVDMVDIRCERGNMRYVSFPIDNVWEIPEGWGGCGVYIKGEPGTTFKLEERASVISAPPAQ